MPKKKGEPTQRKVIRLLRAGALVRRRRHPVVALQHVLELYRLALVRVEAATPRQARVGAAPAAAEPPRARAAVQHVLVHAAVVGRLQARPEVVHARAGELRHDHLARQLGELLARRRVVAQEVPGRRLRGERERAHGGEGGEELELHDDGDGFA